MKKAKFITLILLITVISAVSLSLAVSVSADGPDSISTDDSSFVDSENTSASSKSEGTLQQSDNITAGGGMDTGNDVLPNEFTDSNKDNVEPVSRSFRNALSEHLGEIIGSVTLIMTAVVAILYKRGLVPSVSGAISALNASTGNVMNKMYAYAQSTDEAMEKLAEDISPVSDAVLDFSEKYISLISDVSAVTEKMKIILSSEENLKKLIHMQCEILYSVFMSSNIPQYQKDYLGKLYTQIKLLTDSEDTEEDTAVTKAAEASL